MNIDTLYSKIQAGEISKEELRQQISLNYTETARDAILDTHREMRTGIPEIIYAEHKTFEQVTDIAQTILLEKDMVMISRYGDNEKLVDYFSDSYITHSVDNLVVVGALPEQQSGVLVISGGAADHKLAAEAELALKALGVNSFLYEDRGIAHPTRVMDAIKEGLENNIKAVIVIAGMEASLATLVSSMVAMPVIGVPAAIGYGSRVSETPLYSMLQSCTPNLTVVNINGAMRAAVVSSLIAKQNGSLASSQEND